MRSDKTKRLWFLLAVLAANVVCTAAALCIPIETTSMKIWGSYLAIVLVAAAAWKFPLDFYGAAMIFVFFASSLGSCVNFYRHIGFYDLFVHYLSGIVLAEGGYLLCQALLKKRHMPDDSLTKLLFALFFSGTCAGLWEIYEYTADHLVNAQMQGSKGNIMGDIICGVLGAVSYVGIKLLLKHRKKEPTAP